MASSKAQTPTTLDILGGPDRYHVYLAYYHKESSNSNIPGAIKKLLEVNNFILYKEDEDLSQNENIRTGIENSQKVLFIMTREYLDRNNTWGQYEIKTAIIKSKTRQTKSIVSLLVGQTEKDLPAALQGYITIMHQTDATKFKEDLLTSLAEDVLPQASCFPKYNMGYTLACSHFFGYLRIVLPGLAGRIKEHVQAHPDSQTTTSLRMFAFIPETCQCPADLCKMEQVISCPNAIEFYLDRAGKKARDYKADLYRITDPQTQRVYEAVIEYPGVLTTLYDMVRDPCARMTPEDMRRELKVLFFHLKSLLKQYGLEDTIRLVYIKEKSSPFMDILLNVIQEDLANGNTTPHVSQDAIQEFTCRFSEMNIVPKCTKPVQSTPLEGYLHSYQLTVVPPSTRGKAVIINNKEFMLTSGLLSRNGSEHDIEKMSQLFRTLQFEVCQHENLMSSQIKNVIAELSTEDFSQSQALVICIMTHGKLGKLYGTDGRLVKMTDITQDVANIESLLRKPKLFFIQACQRGKTDSNEAEVSSPVRAPEELGINPQADSDQNASSSSEEEQENGDDLHTASADGEQNNTRARKSSKSKLASDTTETAAHGAKVQLVGQITIAPSTRMVLQTDSDDDGSQSQADLVPGAPDFFMSYSTLPGSLSYRDPSYGSLYIGSLCRNMAKYRQEMPLDRILMKVTEEVKALFERSGHNGHTEETQYPFFLHTCDRLIYLKSSE